MKRKFLSSIIFLTFMLTAFLIMPVMAQTQAGSDQSILEVIGNAFASITGLSGLVLVLTALVKKNVKSNDDITIVISGIISLILSAAGFWLQVGIFVSVAWYYILIYGLAAMLIANGLSTWSLISGILVFFKLKLPQE